MLRRTVFLPSDAIATILKSQRGVEIKRIAIDDDETD